MIKLSIRGRMLLLVFASLLVALLAVGGVALYGLSAARHSVEEQENALGSYLEESMGEYAEKQAKARLKEVATAKAQHIDRVLRVVCDDVAYMSARISLLLQFPENYRSRSLPDVHPGEAAPSGMPYIQYSPALLEQGMDDALRREIGIAGNFADTLTLMCNAYQESQTYFLAGSRHGYMLAMNSDFGNKGDASRTEQAWKQVTADFDHRFRCVFRLFWLPQRIEYRLFHDGTAKFAQSSAAGGRDLF